MTGFGVNVVALRQPLHFQVFSHSKEGVELFLSNIHFAVIRDYDFVGLQLLIIAGKSDIEEILVFAELTERAAEHIQCDFFDNIGILDS